MNPEHLRFQAKKEVTQKKTPTVMQALKMRGKRQSSQGCKNFPADFVRSAKFQWLLAPHWTMARLFLMIAA